MEITINLWTVRRCMKRLPVRLGLAVWLLFLALGFAQQADAKVQVEPMGNCTFYYAVAWMRDELPRPLPYGSAYLGFMRAVTDKCDGKGDWK